jgi:hypothetical protein
MVSGQSYDYVYVQREMQSFPNEIYNVPRVCINSQDCPRGLINEIN